MGLFPCRGTISEGKEEPPIEQEEEVPIPEKPGTEEGPHPWKFEEWDAVNRTLNAKPIAEGQGDESWRNVSADQEKEFKEAMERWSELSESEKAELMQRYAEAQMAAEQAGGTAAAS
eukprot:jgi/Bigna1/79574/fgenesh1_pg.63_\